MPSFGLRGRAPELVRLARLHGQSDVFHPVRHDVEPQDLRGKKGQAQTEEQAPQDREQLAHARRDQEDRGLSDIRERHAPLFDGRTDRGEAVVREDDLAGFLRDIGPDPAHRSAHVSGLEGRGVVDPIAGDGHDVTGLA